MNRKSLLIGILIGMAVLSIANLGFASIGTGEESGSQGLEVIVEPGDTLWAIADRYNEQAGMSINEMLFYIQQENNLESAMVQPGDHIVIPTE